MPSPYVVRGTPVLIDGAFNARTFGSPAPWLLRSSALHALTPSGVEMLRALGVRRVVDLREAGEGEEAGHGLPVERVPLYRLEGGAVPLYGRIEAIYDGLLDTRGEALAEAVAAVASAPGPVAVHCTIGKDRTGLVVALTLLAAGASEDDVLADYVLSGPEVLPHRRAYVEQALAPLDLSEMDRAEAWRLNVESPSEAMRHTFDRLAEWGGAREYLRAHGLAEEHLDSLSRRLA